MTARYLLRFDDICPTMNWQNWARVDACLLRHQVKPILAVVPDNQDPALMVDAPRADFWDYIRSRQQLGWTIALHGWQHRYETRESGLLGINPYSEFAGLPAQVQRAKITSACAKFAQEQVRIDAWVAPGHSFDATTVEVLRQAGIDIISDGFYPRLVRHLDSVWIPQQLWRFRDLPGGLWTVCMHTNGLDETALAAFERDVQRYASRLTPISEALRSRQPAPPGLLDRGFAALWLAMLKIKQRRQQ